MDFSSVRNALQRAIVVINQGVRPGATAAVTSRTNVLSGIDTELARLEQAQLLLDQAATELAGVARTAVSAHAALSVAGYQPPVEYQQFATAAELASEGAGAKYPGSDAENLRMMIWRLKQAREMMLVTPNTTNLAHAGEAVMTAARAALSVTPSV